MTGSLVRFLTVDIFGFLFVNTLLCSFSKGEYTKLNIVLIFVTTIYINTFK